MDNDLGGAFIWSVEMDDFAGKCGKGKYPLLSTVKNIIRPYGVSFSGKQVTPRKAVTSLKSVHKPVRSSEEYEDDEDGEYLTQCSAKSCVCTHIDRNTVTPTS